jgi:hypothetical protein
MLRTYLPMLYKLMRKEDPTRGYLVFYYTYDMLNMFRATLCPSSGAHEYTIAYHMGSLQPGHLTSLPVLNLQPLATQESDNTCGKQRYSRELLMMSIVMPETC